ncbi:hypothetical protein, variant [Exophiala oligosperma]|uniref:Tubulin-specific chaperone A n=1 Tax=Exophiala oligosperma TaxID=215243 RepID=A0A0D2BWN5_9EURO|nr:hypothetical protein, variant [Exophiala oligosperma]KIW41892.1 hypothetical protein, variant [Exophiala oligosperma]
MAPSQIQVAISSLQRLLNEENSYYKEQEQQESRIAKLEKDKTDADGNREFTLRQERQALEETKKVIPTLRERITSAREKLENMLVRKTISPVSNRLFFPLPLPTS